MASLHGGRIDIAASGLAFVTKSKRIWRLAVARNLLLPSMAGKRATFSGTALVP